MTLLWLFAWAMAAQPPVTGWWLAFLVIAAIGSTKPSRSSR